jgi:hypothetical protein
MKLFKCTLLLLSIAFLCACNSNNQNLKMISCNCEKGKSNQNLKTEAANLKNEKQNVVEADPGIITTCYSNEFCKLFVYTPNKLNFHLTNKKPPYIDNIYFSTAAALTLDYNGNICGLFIVDGNEVSPDNEKYTGGCIITNESIEIINNNVFDLDYKNSVIKNKGSYFENALLIDKCNPIEWNLPNGDQPRQRRAIIEINDKFSICESNNAIDIKTFQKALIKIGVENAIYTDMGGWSDGWYKSIDGKQVKIGEVSEFTKFQTNWLYLSIN